jgi:cell division protein FtsB
MFVPAKTKYILISILLIIASINFTKTAYEILKSSKRLDDLHGEINGLEATKTGFIKEIDYKKTQDYVEERARNDLNMIKPGEQILVFVNKNQQNPPSGVPGDVEAATSTRPAPQTNKQSNPQLWYRLFFDK